MKSDVYYINTKGKEIKERIAALRLLLDKLGSMFSYSKEELVAVKITLGDADCVYQVSPELVKEVISRISLKGAKPFLFDTNVIYHGQRQNAVDHMCLAQRKGFVYSDVKAPFIVADGLLGQDGKEVTISAKHIQKIKVPSFVGMLESLVIISHVTGHIVSGFAGAIKNVAMGMSCKPTKQVQHSSLKPNVIENKCIGCGCCIKICPAAAIALKNKKAVIDHALCLGCAECLAACKFNAISINWKEDPIIFMKRMSEVAHYILSQFKNKFFINFAFDVTKECDCMSDKHECMIAQDAGILASRDIVALDKASADLLLENKVSSYLKDKRQEYENMFAYAQELGMGTTEYNLIKVAI